MNPTLKRIFLGPFPPWKFVDYVGMASILVPAGRVFEVFLGEAWWVSLIPIFPLMLIVGVYPQVMPSRWFKPIDAIPIFVLGIAAAQIIHAAGEVFL